jgi:hypothetical protein
MADGQTLRGFVGQSMSGARAQSRPSNYKISSTVIPAAGAFSFTADQTGFAQVFLWGAGGSGVSTGGGSTQGGGSGALVYRLVSVLAGQVISGVIGAGGAGVAGGGGDGNPGGSSTVTYPDGLVVTAGGGRGGGTVGNGLGGSFVLNGGAQGISGNAGGGGTAGIAANADPFLPGFPTSLVQGQGGLGNNTSSPSGAGIDGRALIYFIRS